MTSRPELIERWQTLLEESRQEPAADAPRMRWLRRMRQRLYTFLLAAYGSARWRPDAADVQPDEPPSSSALIDNAPSGGAPPKSAGRIRSTLKALHAAQRDEVELGPLSRGLGKEDWIVVATIRDRLQLKVFLGRLTRHAIRYQTRRRGKRVVVSIPYCDRNLADELLPEASPTYSSQSLRWSFPETNESRQSLAAFDLIRLAIIYLVPNVTGFLIGAYVYACLSTSTIASFPVNLDLLPMVGSLIGFFISFVGHQLFRMRSDRKRE